MLNAQFHLYNFFTLGDLDEYGQEKLNPEEAGVIKIAINTLSQTVTDNILYEKCEYIGLTLDKAVNESYVIQYGNTKLKVKYVNPIGRYTQVFLTNYD